MSKLKVLEMTLISDGHDEADVQQHQILINSQHELILEKIANALENSFIEETYAVQGPNIHKLVLDESIYLDSKDDNPQSRQLIPEI